ncbi:hypothetical protein FRC12_002402 [Ceratobasidium sp. 428]|nr:hypothetical protein FRC12_002402 [Ceratobasidium sp. 428]
MSDSRGEPALRVVVTVVVIEAGDRNTIVSSPTQAPDLRRGPSTGGGDSARVYFRTPTKVSPACYPRQRTNNAGPTTIRNARFELSGNIRAPRACVDWKYDCAPEASGESARFEVSDTNEEGLEEYYPGRSGRSVGFESRDCNQDRSW